MNKKIIEHAPSLISIFTAVLISVSIVFEYGFLSGLGLTFAEVPTTLSDHIRGSLIWIPPLLLILLFNIGIELFVNRAEKKMEEDEITSTSSVSIRSKIYRKIPLSVTFALVLLILLQYFLGSKIYPMFWGALLFCLWDELHTWSFNSERVFQRTSKWFFLATWFIPIIIIFAFFAGQSSADRLPKGTKYVFKINDEEKKVTIARSYEKCYLLWNTETENIELISIDTVKSFSPLKVDTNITSE